MTLKKQSPDATPLANYELDYEAFVELIAEIESQGIPPETAAHYAALLGDTPLRDEHGNVIVMEGERELAVLKPLKFYDGE